MQLPDLLARFRQFRSSTASYTRNAASVVVLSIAAGYLLVLSFPQALFAHEVVYKSFRVYSSAPLDRHLAAVVDRVDSLLAASTIGDPALRPRIFFLNSPQYAALSMYLGRSSFGKSFAALPLDHVFINAHDLANDLVFRDAAENNVRSLSGVIAHEVSHLLVRRKFGYLRNLALPAWKKEGYAEYVAGGSTLPYETGVKMWRESPEDATGYRYFKYYVLVKYLLEHEHITVEDLFNRDIDVERLADVVLKSLYLEASRSRVSSTSTIRSISSSSESVPSPGGPIRPINSSRSGCAT